jgi:hypothetical protein
MVHPRLLLYGLYRGAPGAEACYYSPVGAEQDQDVRVRVVQDVAWRQVRCLEDLGAAAPAHGDFAGIFYQPEGAEEVTYGDW